MWALPPNFPWTSQSLKFTRVHGVVPGRKDHSMLWSPTWSTESLFPIENPRPATLCANFLFYAVWKRWS